MVNETPDFYIYCSIPDIISVISVISMLDSVDTMTGIATEFIKNSLIDILLILLSYLV